MHVARAPNLSRRQFLGAGVGLVAVSTYGTAANRLNASLVTLPAGPQPHRPVRVALLTDMHGPHNWIGQDDLVARVGAFDPHLICIAGDAVDTRGDEPLVRRYADLHARLGKFATLGNWEYQGECDLRRLHAEYERAGVQLLVNEQVRLDDPAGPIDLLGLDDWRAGSPDYAQVASLPAPLAGGARAIVMSHCPVAFDAIVRIAQRPTAVLSGHTHGGQIAPFGLALVLPEGSGSYVRGSYTSADHMHAMYVSRGLGNSGPPFRIGAAPEVALLTV